MRRMRGISASLLLWLLPLSALPQSFTPKDLEGSDGEVGASVQHNAGSLGRGLIAAGTRDWRLRDSASLNRHGFRHGRGLRFAVAHAKLKDQRIGLRRCHEARSRRRSTDQLHTRPRGLGPGVTQPIAIGVRAWRSIQGEQGCNTSRGIAGHRRGGSTVIHRDRHRGWRGRCVAVADDQLKGQSPADAGGT